MRMEGTATLNWIGGSLTMAKLPELRWVAQEMVQRQPREGIRSESNDTRSKRKEMRFDRCATVWRLI